MSARTGTGIKPIKANVIIRNIRSIYSGLFRQKKNKSQEEEILEAVKVALEELRNTELFFQNVTDPDLIDYSIYKMNAALEKYTFLIKLAKQKGVKGRWEIQK